MSQYSWEEYVVYMGGRRITGIRGFKYGTSKVKELIYGEGSEPQGIGSGNKTPKCELKALQSELEAIILSGGGDPVDFPAFTVVHNYQAKKGLPVITDVVEGVEFVDIEKAMDQGKTFMEVNLPMIALRVKYNVIALPNQGKPMY